MNYEVWAAHQVRVRDDWGSQGISRSWLQMLEEWMRELLRACRTIAFASVGGELEVHASHPTASRQGMGDAQPSDRVICTAAMMRWEQE
jgi:hypothetical protein